MNRHTPEETDEEIRIERMNHSDIVIEPAPDETEPEAEAHNGREDESPSTCSNCGFRLQDETGGPLCILCRDVE